MKRRNQGTTLDLTDAEIAVLKSPHAPVEVKAFVSRQHETVGTRITAYEKVAAAARAERLALQEIRRLGLERDSVAATGEYRERIAILENEKVQALEQASTLRQRLMQQTAIPAMAVHSDD